jgi:hypothetical protein
MSAPLRDRGDGPDEREAKKRSYADLRVEVRQLLDGSWRVYAADRLIATAAATNNGELRTVRRRKNSRGAAISAPTHAEYAVAPL